MNSSQHIGERIRYLRLQKGMSQEQLVLHSSVNISYLSFCRLIRYADVPPIPFHDLRHTVTSLMLAENINPKIVKEILGHSDIRVTLDIYSHVLPVVHQQTAS